jgi:hypothetical protein
MQCDAMPRHAVLCYIPYAIMQLIVYASRYPTPSPSLRPIFPKQTQLQKRTLAIHVPTPMLSFVIRRFKPDPSSCDESFLMEILVKDAEGGGTMSGLIDRSTKVPATPTTAESRNPGLDRSMIYHRAGLTRARVRETWRVDCQGSFRYEKLMGFWR